MSSKAKEKDAKAKAKEAKNKPLLERGAPEEKAAPAPKPKSG